MGLPQGGVYPPQGGAAPPTATSPPSGGTITVKSGESLYEIAKSYKVPLRLLIEANRLAPPYVVHDGQQLVLPQTQAVVVNNGDSIDTIALRYGVDESALVRVNDIKPPFKVRIGQVLILPACVEPGPILAGPTASPPPASPGAASPSGVQVMPLSPPPGVAAAANPAKPGSPGPAASPGTAAAPSQFANPLPARPATPPQASAEGPGANEKTAALPPSGPARFQWPLRGTLLSGFGAKESGLFNDGINIAAARGQPVLAAADGVVAYAGNEIRGFGNLVLVKHAEGWMTAYAHNETLLVKRGDRVKRGETIATVGSTGNVSSPQLHFELRHGSHAVDPTKYLPTLSAAS